MTVFLTILKVVGWIVLILFILVVASLLLVLFVPVRYRIVGKKNGGFSLDTRFSWLLHLVRVVVFTEEDDLAAELRILFFRKRLYPSETERMEDGMEEEAWEEFAGVDSREEDNPAREDGSSEKAAGAAREDDSSGEAGQDDSPPEEDGPSRETERDGSLLEDDGSSEKAGQSLFIWLRSMFRGISGKLKDSKKLGKRWQRMLTDEKNRQAAAHLKKEFFFLLKCLTPGRMRLTAAFSTGSPDTTGQLLGVIALFPAAYQNRWQISPDFMADEAYLTFDADIKGRFFLFHAAGIGLRILFDSNCRRLFALLRR